MRELLVITGVEFSGKEDLIQRLLRKEEGKKEFERVIKYREEDNKKKYGYINITPRQFNNIVESGEVLQYSGTDDGKIAVGLAPLRNIWRRGMVPIVDYNDYNEYRQLTGVLDDNFDDTWNRNVLVWSTWEDLKYNVKIKFKAQYERAVSDEEVELVEKKEEGLLSRLNASMVKIRKEVLNRSKPFVLVINKNNLVHGEAKVRRIFNGEGKIEDDGYDELIKYMQDYEGIDFDEELTES